MENLRLIIQNHNFGKVKNQTVSFGITLLKESDTVDSILKRADEALYKAKNSGRNKVSIII